MKLNIILPLVESKNSKLDVTVAKYDSIKSWSCVKDGDSTIVDIEPNRTVNVAIHPDAFTQIMHRMSLYPMWGGAGCITYCAFNGNAIIRSIGAQDVLDTYLKVRDHLNVTCGKLGGDEKASAILKNIVNAFVVAAGKASQVTRPYHVIAGNDSLNMAISTLVEHLSNTVQGLKTRITDIGLHYHGPKKMGVQNLPKQIFMNNSSVIYFDNELSDDMNAPIEFTVDAAL
jgi:hypothetical protein